jgi:hypothetical protein
MNARARPHLELIQVSALPDSAARAHVVTDRQRLTLLAAILGSALAHAFHEVILICSGLLAAGGLAGAVGIVNPPKPVDADGCPGGQLVGAPKPAVAAG